MGNEQIYNPAVGFGGLMEDVGKILAPFVFKMQPMFRVLSEINLFLVVLLFVGLMFYMVFIRKHRIVDKLKKPQNYFAAGIILVIYIILSEAPLKLGKGITVNFGLVALPMAAKLFGPVISGFFGIIQYGASFVMHTGEAFSVSNLFIAGISGILYGWIIYSRRTSYLRCLWAKLVVTIVSNIVLTPMLYVDVMTKQMAEVISQNIITNILLTPVQALAIFVALIIMGKIRKLLSDVSWGM